MPASGGNLLLDHFAEWQQQAFEALGFALESTQRVSERLDR
jgi:predicted ATPase with chaperone activity